ncbi:MAG: hypothetical protein GY937_19890 [bacterium]|nr:hypothetical protein [bacterium]
MVEGSGLEIGRGGLHEMTRSEAHLSLTPLREEVLEGYRLHCLQPP